MESAEMLIETVDQVYTEAEALYKRLGAAWAKVQLNAPHGVQINVIGAAPHYYNGGVATDVVKTYERALLEWRNACVGLFLAEVRARSV